MAPWTDGWVTECGNSWNPKLSVTEVKGEGDGQVKGDKGGQGQVCHENIKRTLGWFMVFRSEFSGGSGGDSNFGRISSAECQS
jgi:hypothetical protein